MFTIPAVSNEVFPTPGAYDPGFRVSLSGAAETGDNFSMEYNNGGTGDNRNAVLLAELQTKKTVKWGE